MTWYDISGQQFLILFEFSMYDLILLFCFDVFLCWLLYAICCLLTLSHSFVQTSFFVEWYVLFSDMIIQRMCMAYIYWMLTTCDTIKSRAIPGPHQFARSLHRQAVTCFVNTWLICWIDWSFCGLHILDHAQYRFGHSLAGADFTTAQWTICMLLYYSTVCDMKLSFGPAYDNIMLCHGKKATRRSCARGLLWHESSWWKSRSDSKCINTVGTWRLMWSFQFARAPCRKHWQEGVDLSEALSYPIEPQILWRFKRLGSTKLWTILVRRRVQILNKSLIMRLTGDSGWIMYVQCTSMYQYLPWEYLMFMDADQKSCMFFHQALILEAKCLVKLQEVVEEQPEVWKWSQGIVVGTDCGQVFLVSWRYTINLFWY